MNYWVGEHGPELMTLSRGAVVVPNGHVKREPPNATKLALSGLGLFIGGIGFAVFIGAIGAECIWRYCEARR